MLWVKELWKACPRNNFIKSFGKFSFAFGGFGTLGGGLKIPAVQRFKWDVVGRSSCVRMFSGEGYLMDCGVAAGFTGRKMVFEARALKR